MSAEEARTEVEAQEEHFSTNWISGSNASGVAKIYDIDEVAKRIIQYIDPTNVDNNDVTKFVVVIGTDSQRHGYNTYKYSTTITVRRMIDDEHGKGGIYFVKNERCIIEGYPRSKAIIAQKIIQEGIYTVATATLIARKVEAEIGRTGNIELIDVLDLHLHFDVSEDGGSNVALGTIKGMASGTGFDYSIKPFAWGASSVANKHSK
jgi:predicted RNase H-related nuclease YkuK (DUF458 family)